MRATLRTDVRISGFPFSDSEPTAMHPSALIRIESDATRVGGCEILVSNYISAGAGDAKTGTDMSLEPKICLWRETQSSAVRQLDLT